MSTYDCPGCRLRKMAPGYCVSCAARMNAERAAGEDLKPLKDSEVESVRMPPELRAACERFELETLQRNVQRVPLAIHAAGFMDHGACSLDDGAHQSWEDETPAEILDVPIDLVPVTPATFDAVEERLLLCATFERVGLLDALRAAGALLDGHGREESKGGDMRWHSKSWVALRRHVSGHLLRTGALAPNGSLDPDSGQLDATHAAVRALMLLSRELQHQTDDNDTIDRSES